MILKVEINYIHASFFIHFTLLALVVRDVEGKPKDFYLYLFVILLSVRILFLLAFCLCYVCFALSNSFFHTNTQILYIFSSSFSHILWVAVCFRLFFCYQFAQMEENHKQSLLCGVCVCEWIVAKWVWVRWTWTKGQITSK